MWKSNQLNETLLLQKNAIVYHKKIDELIVSDGLQNIARPLNSRIRRFIINLLNKEQPMYQICQEIFQMCLTY